MASDSIVEFAAKQGRDSGWFHPADKKLAEASQTQTAISATETVVASNSLRERMLGNSVASQTVETRSDELDTLRAQAATRLEQQVIGKSEAASTSNLLVEARRKLASLIKGVA